MQYAKAIVAALIAGLSVLGTALADGHVTAGEWVGVAGATLVALGAVWGVPNAQQKAAVTATSGTTTGVGMAEPPSTP